MVFAAAFSLTLGLIGLQVFVQEPNRKALAEQAMTAASIQVQREMGLVFQRVKAVSMLRQEWGRNGALNLAQESAAVKILVPLLTHGPNVSSMAMSSESGRELLLFRDGDGQIKTRFTDPDRSPGKAVFKQWSSDGLVKMSEERASEYDSRQRPWFKLAQAAKDMDAIVWTEPFTFRSTGYPGISAVVRWTTPSGENYISTTDITLNDFSRFTRAIRVAQHGFAAAFGKDGRLVGLPFSSQAMDERDIIASVLKPVPDFGNAALTQLYLLWKSDPTVENQSLRFEIDGDVWLGMVSSDADSPTAIRVAVLVPERDFAPTRWSQILVVVGIIMAAILLSWVVARRLSGYFSKPLKALADESERIGRLELTDPVSVPSIWSEVDAVAQAQESMRMRLYSATEQLEESVKVRTAELDNANHSLKAALDQQQTLQAELVESGKLAALGNLVAGVAHEMNTPLGNAVLAADTVSSKVEQFRQKSASGLRRSDLDLFIHEINEGAKLILGNVQRASAMVENFKQLAVDQASGLRRRFMLRDVLNEAVSAISPTLKRSPIKLHLELEATAELDSIPGPLSQVVINLISNAFVHGFPDQSRGDIWLESSMNGASEVVIKIRDNGAGIPDENKHRIFEPFFTTRFGKGGSGLGLHIVHTIVTGVLGGRIAVSSQLGQGTIFSVTIPLIAPINLNRPGYREGPSE